MTGSVSSAVQSAAAAASQNATSTHRQPEVKFGTVVLHRVSVYITWPRHASCNTTTSDVAGYRLRYRAVDDADEFVVRQLTDNFVLLENVETNVRYRFQVQYVLADSSETDWSADGVVNTSPIHRQPATD